MFDSNLGTCNTTPLYLQLKDDSNPVCLKPYSVPRLHSSVFRKEANRLVSLVVIGHANDSEWGDPYFAEPKAKTNIFHLLSDCQNLNSQLKCKHNPVPKIHQMLLELEGFKYATSLELNKGYYHRLLRKETSNFCTIILPRRKYRQKHLPMRVINAPGNFQAKTNEMFHCFEFI